MYRRAHWYVLVIAILSLIGFVPIYLGNFSDMRLAHHLHLLTASGWVALLIAQPWLAASGGIVLHRTLGILGVGVFTGFYAMSMYITWYTAGFAAQEGIPLSVLLWFDAVAMQLALLAVVLAIIYRSRVETHQRLMVSTTLVLVVPGFGRTIGGFVLGPLGLPGIAFPFIVFGTLILGTTAWAWVDRFKNKVTLAVMLATIALTLSSLMVGNSAWWKDLMTTYGNPIEAYHPYSRDR